MDVLGYTIILPLLPFYAENLGATPVTVGFLLASYGFCQMLAGPVLGRLSDRIGRKPVLFFSQLGTFAGFLLLAWAPDLKWIFIARIIDGITAGNLSVAQACIADVTEPKDRAKSFALIGISFGLGFLVGPGISGLLTHFGPQYPILAAAFLSGLSILGTLFLLPNIPIHHTPGGFAFFDVPVYKKLFSEPELGGYLKEFFSFIFAFSLFISGFALFAERRFIFQGHPFGAREVSYVFAFVGMFGILVQGFGTAHMVRFFGEKKLVRMGFVFMTLGFLVLSFAGTIPALLFAVCVSFFGSSILRPSLTSLITQKAEKGQQGIVLGMTQSLTSLCQVVTPLISGVLIQHGLLPAWALVGAFAAVLGLFFKVGP